MEAAIQRTELSPRLRVALGYIRYHQGALTEARRLLEPADGALLGAAPTDRERAFVNYLLGAIEQSNWRDWRSFGELSTSSEGRWSCEPYLQDLLAMSEPTEGALAAAARLERPSPVDINVACAAQFESIMDDYFHLNADLKREARDRLEAHFRRAITADPTYWPPYHALAAELTFEAAWAELGAVGTDAGQALPDDYRPFLLRALAAYRLQRLQDAARLFDSALTLMPDDLRAWYRNPEPVLSIAETRALAQQPAEVRAAWSQAFWRSRQVSFYTEQNDRLLEHYGRLTEADLVFGIPALGIAGWNTDPGSAWVRYGRPLKIRDLALQNGRASFWTYGPDPDLVFTRMLTYAEYRVHHHLAPQLDLLHEKVPTRFRPPGVDTVVALDHQVVRFRGDSGRVDVLVVAGPRSPLDPAPSGWAAVTLLNTAFTRVAQWRSLSIPRGLAVTIAGVRPRGTHNIVVEVMDTARRVLAEARDTIPLTPPASGAAMSDLLLAQHVEGPEGGTTRADLAIEHLYGRTVIQGDPIALAWEIYGLARTSDGHWRYRVTLEIRNAEGRSLFVQLLGFGRPRSTALSYERAVTPTRDRTVEWTNLAGEWTPGRYSATVVIDDLAGGGTTTATTWFMVQPPPDAR